MTLRFSSVACAALFALTASSSAQTTTGTIRGAVKDQNGVAQSGAEVQARNVETGVPRTATTRADGSYVLPGLVPGTYDLVVRHIGNVPQRRQVVVQIGATLLVDFTLQAGAVELEAVTVEAGPAVEMRTSESATNISQAQIQSLPLNDRNFLSLAALAPGLSFGCQGGNCPPGDGGGLNSGAESANQVNVFVDGVSFKNDILKGGVAGQDASKGNPFPQVAVQEFRIITQQYKAEYQKATSAVVTATTRSGTNRWQGELFGFRQDEGLIERDFFTIKRCNDSKAANPAFVCADQPKQGRWQMGGSVGGPIIQDKLFFFGAFEGNHQDRAFTVTPLSLGQWPVSIQQELADHEGTFGSPFRSSLYFGKLTYAPNERHRLELSGNVRDEYDVRNFGGRDALENAEEFNNDVRTFLLKHQYSRGSLLNEAQVSHQTYHWFPIQLRTDLIGRNYDQSLKLGGRCCPQDQTQRRLQLRNDITYTAAGGRGGDHVFKAGASIDFVEYDILKQLFVNPQFLFRPTRPDFPSEVDVGFGEPDIGAKNTMFGIYAQDDWSPSRRLTLNLGLRWDYESNGLNNDYVTPPQVVTEVGSRTDLIIINANYFTDGTDRPAFLGAFQPRLGFSYDLTGDNSTVLFGGFGVYYDRNSYATLIGERERLVWKTYKILFAHPDSTPTAGQVVWNDSYYDRDALEALISSGTTGKPEVFLVHNRTKPPRANHFSLGVRRAWREFLFSVNYTGVRSYNNFTWMFANRNNPGPPATFELPSYRNVLVSTDQGRAWYDAIFFKAEKRYSVDSRWGATLAYTLGWADDNFSAGRDFGGLDFRTPANFVRRRSERDQRHIVTANGMVGLPLDIRLSGIVSLASGRPYRVFYGGDAFTTGNMDGIGNEYPDGGADGTVWGGTNPFTGEPHTNSFLGIGGWAFRNVDLRLEREFEYRNHRIGLIAEGFNVFNFDNYTAYEGRIGNLQTDGSVVPNANFGNRTEVITDTRLPGAPRRWQFGLTYAF